MSQSANRTILVGSVDAGKTTLLNALLGMKEEARKTQAVEYEGALVDTPGEFFNHPRLYHALIMSTVDVDTIVYVHPANDFEYKMPTGLLEVHKDKDVIVVITKVDLPNADVSRVKLMLEQQNFKGRIFLLSPNDSQALKAIKDYLRL